MMEANEQLPSLKTDLGRTYYSPACADTAAPVAIRHAEETFKKRIEELRRRADHVLGHVRELTERQRVADTRQDITATSILEKAARALYEIERDLQTVHHNLQDELEPLRKEQSADISADADTPASQ